MKTSDDDIRRALMAGKIDPLPSPRTERERAHTIATRCISDIESKPIAWLWPGRIARGKLTIIAGNPGLGKSQLSASMAAIVTTGGRWPVEGGVSSRGSVLFVNCEDDPADTLRPRLEAAGADLRLVHVLDGVTAGSRGDGSVALRSFNLADDLGPLDAKLDELQTVAMVVIDPITAFLGAGTDSHKNADIRALLAPLSELAAKRNAAIIGVSHLSKGGGQQALMRVSGSLAFTAAARAAYLVAQDPEDPARRLFLPMKNNIGPDTGGLSFRIEPVTVQSGAGPIGTSRVVWESGKVDQTADEVLSAASRPEERSAMADAVRWLSDVLGDGPLPAKSIRSKAENDGLSWKTIQRAAEALSVDKRKGGMAAGWDWSLPKMTKNAEESRQKDMGIFGGFGHLRQGEPTGEPSEVVI